MPLYDYEGPEGVRREVLVPRPPPLWIGAWRLAPIQSFRALRSHREPSLGDQIMRGYRTEEARHGSRFRTRLPAAKIKEAWADEVTR